MVSDLIAGQSVFWQLKKISGSAVPEATELKRSEKGKMDLGPAPGSEHYNAHLWNDHRAHYFDPGIEGVQ
jgi:hypothetical protein